MFLVGLPVWYFFGVLVRSGTDLGQDFSGMACIYIYIAFFILLISLLLICYFM